MIGLSLPLASAGFYANPEQSNAILAKFETAPSNNELAKLYTPCYPIGACIGSCWNTTTNKFMIKDGLEVEPCADPRGEWCCVDCDCAMQSKDTHSYAMAINGECPTPPGKLHVCPGALGEDICAPGYTGDRCAKCKKDKSAPCSDDDPLGANVYYRLNSKCEPCPCNPWSLTTVAIVLIIIAAVLMVALDRLFKGMEHLDAVFAPIMILVTYYQTLALLLELPTNWPPILQTALESLQFLNVNLETTGPECSGDYDAVGKLGISITLPLLILATLGGYAVVQYILLKSQDSKEFQRQHDGYTVVKYIRTQVTTVAVVCYLVGALPFLRMMFGVYVCTPEDPAGNSWLESQPDLACSTDNDTYIELIALSTTGITGFLVATGFLAVALKLNQGVRRALGENKFEETYFFWELVLLGRKILIMMSFTFYRDNNEQAWFMGSTVIMLSLLLHAVAKPFEDQLIDWVEFLSLISTLVMFMTAGAIMILNNAKNKDETEAARDLVATLEYISLLVVLAVTVLGAVIEAAVFRKVRGDEDSEDYRVELLKNRQEDLQNEITRCQTELKKQERN